MTRDLSKRSVGFVHVFVCVKAIAAG